MAKAPMKAKGKGKMSFAGGTDKKKVMADESPKKKKKK